MQTDEEASPTAQNGTVLRRRVKRGRFARAPKFISILAGAMGGVFFRKFRSVILFGLQTCQYKARRYQVLASQVRSMLRDDPRRGGRRERTEIQSGAHSTQAAHPFGAICSGSGAPARRPVKSIMNSD